MNMFACVTDVDDDSKRTAFAGGRLARLRDDDVYFMMICSRLMMEETLLYSLEVAGCIGAAQEGQCRYVR